MGKTFNVYLKDRGSSGEEWGEGDMYEVGLQLKGLFDEVCLHPDSAFSQSDFWWDPAPGTILDHELLVYFLPDALSKRVRQYKGAL